MQHQSTNDARLIRMKQVQAMTSLSRSYIYSLASTGKFPKSIPLVPGGSSRAFLESEIQDWIDQRIEARDQEV
jgi:prophage regulatory protein